MDDKPLAWKQFIALGLMCTGFTMGHRLSPTYDVVATVICLELFAVINWWMHAVDYLEYRRDYRRLIWGSEPKQIKPEPEQRKWLSLKEVDGVWQSTSVATNLLQKDKRWQTFGVAVINNRPMTQASWTGRGKFFSKTEFVKQMNAWLTDAVVVPKKGKGNSGYRPNGAAGWMYFKDLADGRKFIPLPMKEQE